MECTCQLLVALGAQSGQNSNCGVLCMWEGRASACGKGEQGGTTMFMQYRKYSTREWS